MSRRFTVLVGRRCDAAMNWADRATMRGVAVAVVSNTVLSALAWPRLSSYYDARFSILALILTLMVGFYFTAQVLRRVFRRNTVRALVGAHIVSALALVVAPKHGNAAAGLSWTHPWMITTVCAAMLLLPRRERWPVVSTIATLGWLIRIQTGGPWISLVEALIAVMGALITAWAAESATRRFSEAAAALSLATEAEASATEAATRDHARAWWDRLLHDKVLGALVLTERALSPTALTRARQLAAEAIDTMETMDSVHELESEGTPQEAEDSVLDLVESLRRIADANGLRLQLTARGRGAPSVVSHAVSEAASQALRNIAQHSGANVALVSVTQSPVRVVVEVRDSGVGFDPAAVSARRFGLRTSMPGHMALVGGDVNVKSSPGNGTRVRLTWSDQSARERGASISRKQRQSWWWVTLMYSGLHLVGGLIAPAPLAHGPSAWLALAAWLSAMVAMHLLRGRFVLSTVPWIVIAADAVLLWSTPSLGADGWVVWFLGASYPALCLPALRGRPTVALASGVTLATVIVTISTFRWPGGFAHGLEFGIPFVIIPAIAALYAVALTRADTRLHQAQQATADARAKLRLVTARRAMLSSSVQTLSEGTLPLLRKLVSGDVITAVDRRAAHSLEMANRDLMVAAEVLTPHLVTRLSEARSRGASVTLSSMTGQAPDSPSLEAVASRLAEFRERLVVVLEAAGPDDHVTARWQPNNGYAAGTIAREHPTDDGRSMMFTISPLPSADVSFAAEQPTPPSS